MRKTVMPEEGNARLFALLVNSLYAMDRGASAQNTLIFFVFKLLDILGLRPATESCAFCGSPEVCKVNIGAGGMVCKKLSGGRDSQGIYRGHRPNFKDAFKGVSKIELPEQKGLYVLAIRWLTDTLEVTPKKFVIIKRLLKI